MSSDTTSPRLQDAHAICASRLSMWIALLVLGAALAIRLLWLEADPATTLSWSGAPFTDEGLYSHAARNRVLFGVWRTDGWDDRLVSPLFDGLAFLVFSVFGVGYVQLRLISVVFAIVALLLFSDLLRADFGERWALLGAALWGTDYFWFQYSRLGLIEPGMVAWLVAAAWCWRRALSGSIRSAIACGVCAGIGVVWKSLGLIVVPAPLIALLLINRSWPRRRVSAGYLLGFGLIFGLYVLIWYLPHRSEIAHYNRFYAADRIPDSLSDAVRVLLTNLRSRYVWGQTPILLGFALVGALRAGVAKRRLPPVVALSLAWALCGGALLLMPYSPPRYYTLLPPALVCLAIYSVRYTDNHRLITFATPLVGALVSLSLLWSGWWYLRWTADRRTTLIDGSRAVQALVPSGELVLGVHACGLSLANALPCAPPFAGLANDDRPVETLGARYALVEQGNPDDYLRRFYAPLLARSTVLQTLPVGPRRVTLYQLNDQ